MLFAAFLLWYITKLGETYTTDHEVTIVIDGQEIEVDCTIRGKGTDLIHYTLSSSRSRFEIPATEVIENVITDERGHLVRHVNGVALQQALASRMSDITVVAVGPVAPLKSLPKVERTKPEEGKAESETNNVIVAEEVAAEEVVDTLSLQVVDVVEEADSAEVLPCDVVEEVAE